MTAKALFLELDFPGFLDKLARSATESSTAVSASSSPNGIALADLLPVEHLQDKTETKEAIEPCMHHAVSTAGISALLRVDLPVRVEVVVAVLDLAIDDARTAPRHATSSGLVAAGT
jgi:hypothetical protein